MEQILNYFETIPSLHRSIILVGGLSFFWLLEGAMPLVSFKYNKWRHALPNLFFTGTTIIINFSLAFLLLKSADWVVENQFGVLLVARNAIMAFCTSWCFAHGPR